MSPRPAVVDTNVVVAGLLTSDAGSPTARILDAMLAARFSFLLSVPLVAEYRRVLLRPRIRRLHGLRPRDVDKILTELSLRAMIVETPGADAAASGDQHLWDLLAGRSDAVLVTGDQALLRRPRPGATVFSPRDFADSMI